MNHGVQRFRQTERLEGPQGKLQASGRNRPYDQDRRLGGRGDDLLRRLPNAPLRRSCLPARSGDDQRPGLSDRPRRQGTERQGSDQMLLAQARGPDAVLDGRGQGLKRETGPAGLTRRTGRSDTDRRLLLRLDPDLLHHPLVLVQKNVAVKDERPVEALEAGAELDLPGEVLVGSDLRPWRHQNRIAPRSWISLLVDELEGVDMDVEGV